ncbi:MAG: type II toxin-antitoxin system death-on-curing family toxin [Candidatus Devosia euplotis]|nr:type II toxin-antitoxin system death-on-curing family toxin [Candidatus Devosia euplotis]
MHSYLTPDEVLRMHEILLEAFGGAPGVRDADLIEEAAALWESMAMNHGFIDGNKRAAYASVELFLQMNGVDIAAGNDELELFIYSNLEAGTFKKDALETWLPGHSEALASSSGHEGP